MGSVSASALIISISFFISFTLVYAATMDSQHDFEKAMELREKLDKNYYQSSIKISAVYVNGSAVSMLILNDGNVPLNPYYLSVLINGTYYPEKSVSVGGVSTGVWAPGEYANVTVGFGGSPYRIKVITQYGNSDYYEVS